MAHSNYDDTDKQRTWNNPKKMAIARNMLERYTGTRAKDFQKHIIYYVYIFKNSDSVLILKLMIKKFINTTGN